MLKLIPVIAALLLAACSGLSDAKPALPTSVSPGWSLKSLDRQPGPASPVCWRADYEGPGSVEVSVCRYSVEAGAFDAVQRTGAAAQTVKFQVGANFVLVQWNNVQKTDLEALIRAIQKALKP